MSTRSKHLRSKKGSALAEFAPALFILLFLFFFPGIDAMTVGLTYMCGKSLNATQTREAALIQASEARRSDGPIKKAIPEKWIADGWGSMLKITSPIETDVYHGNTTYGTMMVTVTTKLTCSPVMPIPYIPNVPGLSAPMTLSFSSSRQVENPDNM